MSLNITNKNIIVDYFRVVFLPMLFIVNKTNQETQFECETCICFDSEDSI